MKKTEDFQVGDLVYYFQISSSSDSGEDNKPKLAIIAKAKNLLKLYDIIIQTENVYKKNVHIIWLRKAT
jgi:hypothetical protein